MIELTHIILGFLSLVAGAAVILLRKGTKKHRSIGRVYILSMLGLNLTSFGIYNLYGSWGRFHWLALVSLATLIAAYASIRYKKVQAHYYFSVWSYVGLLGGAISELFARFPPAELLLKYVPSLDTYVILLLITATFYLLPKCQNKVLVNV